MEANEHNHYRGLHIVIINPQDDEIVAAKIFDTYNASRSFDDFIQKQIPHGHIVVAACMDDCISALSQKGYMWLE